jgi:dTDP-4-amino-4,6-dideoxygalactose transaminase
MGLVRGKSECDRFTEELKSHFGKRHCFLVSSGKAALTLILQALNDLYPGRDKVLIPAYTCYSVPSAITRAGLKVSLCDLRSGSFDFDFQKLMPLLSDERLLCIIPTHLYGVPADIDGLRKILGATPVALVEDAAQAMGNTWKGRKLGALGDISFFSLGRGKAFSTVEGAIILTDREDLAAAIARQYESLPAPGSSEVMSLIFYALALRVLVHPSFYWLPSSLPFLRLGETIYDPGFKIRKFSAFQAGLARGWVERLSDLRERRRANAQFWQESINKENYRTFSIQGEEDPDFLRFPVVVKDCALRSNLLLQGNRLGLGIAPGYPDTIDGIPEIKPVVSGLDFTEARYVANRVMTLPVHPLLSPKDKSRTVNLLMKAVTT